MFRSSVLRAAPRTRLFRSSIRRHYATEPIEATLYDVLESRGLVSQCTDDAKLRGIFQSKEKIAFYLGIDPSGPTLHAGHLLPLIVMLHFQLRGHRPFLLIGGATGLVGDPSFRTTDRDHLPEQTVQRNVRGLIEGIHQFVGMAMRRISETPFGARHDGFQALEVVNNADWHTNLSILQFLSQSGGVRVNSMISRDSMQSRLNAPEGLTFRELTYQLLQAHDFYHLWKEHNCRLQIGGGDQWGNIITGLDLISRHRSQAKISTGVQQKVKGEVFGLTTPLLLSPSGEKFGKSAGNAVWLDKNATPILDFYQHFLQCPDAVMETYLKLFTFLTLEDIQAVLADHRRDPSARVAQRTLASELTALIHGEDAMHHARDMTRLLFTDSQVEVENPDKFRSVLAGSQRYYALSQEDQNREPLLLELAVKSGLVASKSQGRILVEAGGLYVNGAKVTSVSQTAKHEDFIKGLLFLRAGKNKPVVVDREPPASHHPSSSSAA